MVQNYWQEGIADMSEILSPRDYTESLLADIHRLVQVSVIVGIDTLSCASADGMYLFRLVPAKQTIDEVMQLPVAEIPSVREWTLIRLAAEDENGSVGMTIFGIHTGDEGELFMLATEHEFPRETQDLDISNKIINSSIILQYEAGLATPNARDYDDFEEALREITRYTEGMILLQQLGSLLPYNFDDEAQRN